MKLKNLITIVLFLLIYPACYAQTNGFAVIMSAVKQKFKSPDLTQKDYGAIIKNLNSAIAIDPNNAEAHYYLGYAYSRYNSSDATSIPVMQLPLVLKSSKELETVNKLSPLYTGELIVLDPYAKLSSEWGVMALAYLYNNKPDSAKWAFQQGKQRGGFTDFTLSVNRALLNSCSKNSILVSSGDGYTLPLYYLQVVEKLRPDVSLVDISMLNAVWYPQFLANNKVVEFGLDKVTLDTLQYKLWPETKVSIPIFNTGKQFEWLVKPTYEKQYVLRGDRLFLTLLKTNQFKRDVYFTKAFVSTDQLGLDEHLLSYALVDKINITNQAPLTTPEYFADIKKASATFSPASKNSAGELIPIDVLRIDILNKLDEMVKQDNKPGVSMLFDLLDNDLSESKYSKYSAEYKEYMNQLRGKK